MDRKRQSSSRGKKYKINNNDCYNFDWIMGDMDSNILIENKKLNISMNRYLIKNGQEIDYDGLGIAESKNNIVTVIVNQNKEIGLIWEWRPIPEKFFWACVRGFSERSDKNSIDSAKRELFEEIGNFKIKKSKSIGLLFQNTTFYENPVNLILLYVEDKGKRNEDLNINEGILRFSFFPIEIIKKMIRENEIQDTFTLSALMKYFSIIE